MDKTSYTVRVSKRWARIAMIAGIAALIVAPLTAVASHSFNDVPNSHTFHADIAWMKDSDVTRGCNPPANTLYCPEDNVSRAQMAAFMRRFSQYIGAEDGTPAQADNATNAAMLGGQGPAAYDTFVVGASDEDLGTKSSTTAVASTSWSAPTATSVVVTGTASFNRNTGAFVDTAIWAQHNDTSCALDDRIPGAVALATVAPEPTEPLNNSAAFTAAISLPAGNHSLTLCLEPSGGNINLQSVGITGVVSPSASSSVSSATPSASDTGR